MEGGKGSRARVKSFSGSAVIGERRSHQRSSHTSLHLNCLWNKVLGPVSQLSHRFEHAVRAQRWVESRLHQLLPRLRRHPEVSLIKLSSRVHSSVAQTLSFGFESQLQIVLRVVGELGLQRCPRSIPRASARPILELRFATRRLLHDLRSRT